MCIEVEHDEAQILRLYKTCARAVGLHRFADWLACFAPDATLTSRGRTISGHVELDAFITSTYEHVPEWFNVPANVVIHVTGETAVGEADYFLIRPNDPDDERRGFGIAQAGRYVDSFRKEDGRWVIVERRIQPWGWHDSDTDG